jgi:hypothetical protein
VEVERLFAHVRGKRVPWVRQRGQLESHRHSLG